MRTQHRIVGLVIVATLEACSPGPTAEDKRAIVMAMRRELAADLVRQEGECRAVAVEFPEIPGALANCLDTYRRHVELTQKIYRDIDARLAQIDATGK